MTRTLVTACRFAVCVPPALFAGTALAAAEPPAPVGAGMALQVLIGLVLVLAMIFAAAWAMRRFTPGASPSGQVRVVGAAALGQRERLVLVEIGDTWIAVGVAPGRVNLLCTQARPPQSDAVPDAVTPSGGFRDWLNQALQRRS